MHFRHVISLLTRRSVTVSVCVSLSQCDRVVSSDAQSPPKSKSLRVFLFSTIYRVVTHAAYHLPFHERNLNREISITRLSVDSEIREHTKKEKRETKVERS